MPPHIPSPMPVDLEGNVKLGVKTLIAVLISVVLGTVTLVGLYYRLPTKEDLLNFFKKHDESQDSHPKMSEKLDSVQVQIGVVDGRLKSLEEKQKEVGYIRARIDFLTEQAVREKSSSRWAGDQAVKKLRAGVQPADVIDE